MIFLGYVALTVFLLVVLIKGNQDLVEENREVLDENKQLRRTVARLAGHPSTQDGAQ